MAVVHVAVGVICDDQHNILIAKRSADRHQGGLWEFPGGKVESGESLVEALERELQEEIGISLVLEQCSPLLKIEHDYGDKQVCLDVCWVRGFRGQPHGREGQPLMWVAPQNLSQYPFPEANRAIIDAIMASAP